MRPSRAYNAAHDEFAKVNINITLLWLIQFQYQTKVSLESMSRPAFSRRKLRQREEEDHKKEIYNVTHYKKNQPTTLCTQHIVPETYCTIVRNTYETYFNMNALAPYSIAISWTKTNPSMNKKHVFAG